MKRQYRFLIFAIVIMVIARHGEAKGASSHGSAAPSSSHSTNQAPKPTNATGTVSWGRSWDITVEVRTGNVTHAPVSFSQSQSQPQPPSSTPQQSLATPKQ